jgi:hypothetical protein
MTDGQGEPTVPHNAFYTVDADFRVLRQERISTRGSMTTTLKEKGEGIMKKISLTLMMLLMAAALSACSPQYDWRDYRSNDAPYAALFPGKPATQTRPVKLDNLDVDMTMTAAEVDGVVFAVGSAQLADAAGTPAALEAMKTALVNNIGATVTKAKASSSATTGGKQTVLDVEAKGNRNGEPMVLIGRFIAKDKRIYQVIVMGREKNIVPDTVDTWFSSFKLN